MNDTRKTRGSREWRNKVKHRDGNTCRRCEFKSNLHVHHIKPRAKYPEFDFVLDNGLTLCGNCHSLLKGREESTNLIEFLGADTRIAEQLRAINGSFSNYLERQLKSGSQHARDDAISKLFSHLTVYPNSISEMLLLLVYVIDSENWGDGSDTKFQAIRWLRTDTEVERHSAPDRNWQLILPCPRCQTKLRIRLRELRNHVREDTAEITLRINCPRGHRFERGIRAQLLAATAIIAHERRVMQQRQEAERQRRIEQQQIEQQERLRQKEQQRRQEQQRIEQQEQLRQEAEQREQGDGCLWMIWIVVGLVVFGGLMGSC